VLRLIIILLYLVNPAVSSWGMDREEGYSDF